MVLDGNPLVDVKNTNSIRYVMKAGDSTDPGTTLDPSRLEANILRAPRRNTRHPNRLSFLLV